MYIRSIRKDFFGVRRGTPGSQLLNEDEKRILLNSFIFLPVPQDTRYTVKEDQGSKGARDYMHVDKILRGAR
jgi:hypothetical protein